MSNGDSIKVVLLGEAGVGKTSIIHQFTYHQFDPDCISSISAQFISKTIDYPGYGAIKYDIWDTAGQERYRSITNAYYKGAKGALLVYDITNKKSFDNLDRWVSDLKVNADDKISIVLLGNKSDLENQRIIKTEEGKNKAEFYKFAFMETSALNGNNIKKTFNELIMDVYKNNHQTFEKQAKVQINSDKNSIELNKGIDDYNNRSNERRWCCW